MSQPIKSLHPDDDPMAQEIVSIDQLIEIFRAAEKNPRSYMMGLEYEQFGYIKSDLSPIPFHGPKSISAVFEKLARDLNYRKITILKVTKK